MAMEHELPVVGSADVSVAVQSDGEMQSSNAAELRVVYLATAADTSCVNHDDDSSQHAVVSVGEVSQHMIMDIEGSDNDDTELADTCGTATMLQRN